MSFGEMPPSIGSKVNEWKMLLVCAVIGIIMFRNVSLVHANKINELFEYVEMIASHAKEISLLNTHL